MKFEDFNQLEKCKHDLLGTTDSVVGWCQKNEVPEDFAEDIEAEIGQDIEVCPECGWWVECGELSDQDGEPCSCYECR